MSRIEEIRARVDNDAKVAEMCGQAQWVRRIDDIRFLLAERDRLAAEVEAARDSLAAIADEPGCCADIADAKAFAREARARLGGGGK